MQTLKRIPALKVAPTLRAQVVVIGSGIAGTWLALKLARSGVDTLIIHYDGKDRGGLIGSSMRSVGAINTSPLERKDFREYLDDLSQGQHHPSIADLLINYLPVELAELLTLAEFKNIKLGVALSNGNAGLLLRQLRDLFESSGGRTLNAWVTRIVADEETCRGVQYQKDDSIGKVLAPVIVIASGGYTGLFHGSVKTNNHGSVLGRFLHAGGIATNLEFVFKHGYGKPDLGALTPTEELPGAEIYDDAGVHVEWLERELYEGRGTANHLEAFKHWRRNKNHDFFIDLKFRTLCSKLQAINRAISEPSVEKGFESVEALIRDVADMCPVAERSALEGKLRLWALAGERIDFERFNEVKPYFVSVSEGEVFRVRQIAYFSMGGIAHVNCATNLANVFVTGEAMHDFGAHRVGGLPWGLYLATGRFISELLVDLRSAGGFADNGDFDLINADCGFDEAMLEDIRVGLYEHHERDLSVTEAMDFVDWIRGKRRELIESGRELDDAVAWLIVAEAVMQSSLRRMESRGCFYRGDHPITLDEMKGQFSYCRYDAEVDAVNADMIHISELSNVILHDPYVEEYQAVEG